MTYPFLPFYFLDRKNTKWSVRDRLNFDITNHQYETNHQDKTNHQEKGIIKIKRNINTERIIKTKRIHLDDLFILMISSY